MLPSTPFHRLGPLLAVLAVWDTAPSVASKEVSDEKLFSTTAAAIDDKESDGESVLKQGIQGLVSRVEEEMGGLELSRFI
ncbi:hypothetical protein B0T21DRAFT_358635 [Apiosordaria backusii]|uniref:Uncharacterized protein n=1 Tax=Apiosordaria backusii TaxID=314023 RepID=A0AA40ET31_9PEZI|nr:hypothetical protein B0T21DRAFT_358635 [Apiosordaria backusii]